MTLFCLSLYFLTAVLIFDNIDAFLVSDMRLSHVHSGYIQLEKDGNSGTICSDHFTDLDAKVVCREAGFGNTGIAIPVHESIYGGGSGPIHYDELACTGTENSVGSCKHSTFLDCEHSEDAGVICDKDDFNISLSNGDFGLLEVTINGKKGTVCDDRFTHNAARVVCRQLGLPTSYAHYGKHHGYTPASVPIFLDDVVCNGTEDNLLKCKMGTVGKTDCIHEEDIMVYCTLPTTTTSTTTVPTTSSCHDDYRVNCSPSVCSGFLKAVCPVTCNLCSPPTTLPTAQTHCMDSPLVNCQDKTTCIDPILQTLCKMSCGICTATLTTTSWLPITHN